MFMTYGRKLDFPNRLATLSEKQHEDVQKILGIYKRIEYCWMQYPFYLSVFTALIVYLWVGSGGYQILPDLGFKPWGVGILWGMVSFLLVVPVWKLALLNDCKRIFKELEVELATYRETYRGRWALWFISTAEVDEIPLRLVNSAGRRGLVDWFQL